MSRPDDRPFAVVLRGSVAAVIAVIAVSAVGGAARAPRADRDARRETTSRTRAGEVRRLWGFETNSDGRLQMRIERHWGEGHSHSTFSWSFDTDRGELEGLPANLDDADDTPVRFRMTRDPGTLVFEGHVDHGIGRGRYTFEPHEAFRRSMERAGMRRPTDDDLERLCSHEVRMATIEALADAGYAGLTTDDLMRLSTHGASPQFVGDMMHAGYRGLTVDDLVRLRIHDVSPSLVREYAELGYHHPSVDELVRLKDNGVEPSYVREMRGLEPKPSVDDLVRFRQHGVTPEFAHQFAALGYRHLTAEDLVRFRLHGVTPEFARKALAEHPGLSADELVRLRLTGRL